MQSPFIRIDTLTDMSERLYDVHPYRIRSMMDMVRKVNIIKITLTVLEIS
jgi:hypothetical protein